MKPLFSFRIYTQTAQLPDKWNDVAAHNVFLLRDYLFVLEQSAPANMVCHYIGIFENDQLVGVALSQFLDLNALASFGERDKCIKSAVRNFLFKKLSSNVLVIGNNMLTGQNAFSVLESTNTDAALKALKMACKKLIADFKSKGIKIHITTYKDFLEADIQKFATPDFASIFQFSTQPNMHFDIPEQWQSEQDYIDALSKKYRDQYKRARKKATGIVKQKMSLSDIIAHEDTIYNLYYHVAQNAPFNTFFLNKNHFRIFKEVLQDTFLFYGYFMDDKLIGFNTLIKNGNTMDTYFLGYDESIQRDKMLYLNMLYDMIGYSINKGYSEIIFARTALEIKSSVGAKPQKMYGLMEHSNPIINKNIAQLFGYLEPETIWQERNPFK